MNLTPGATDQQDALVSALTGILWQARSGPSASLALLPSHDSGARLSHDMLVRGTTLVTAASREALQVRGAQHRSCFLVHV